MDQKKIGDFLKQLRKEKGLTQEQFAEHFNVSNRSVSRWETGATMPDLSALVEIADFYEIDIRELIDTERKGEKMGNDVKDTLKKVAEYSSEEKKKLRDKMASMLMGATIILLFFYILTSTNGLNGFINEKAYCDFSVFATGLATSVMILSVLYLLGLFDHICELKRKFINGK